MTIYIEPWVRPEFAVEIKGFIEKWQWFVPVWVSQITVSSETDGKYALQIELSEEYRTAVIRIGVDYAAAFTNHTLEHLLVHELAHFYTIPTQRAAKDILNKMGKEGEPAYEIAWEWITQTMERSTEDLAQTLIRRGP